MRALIVLCGASLLGGGLYASDVFTPGSVYDKPFVEAYDDLSRMKLLPLLGQSAPYRVKRPDIAAMTLTRTSDSLNWRIAIGPN